MKPDRTRADRLADSVSLVVLLALGGFAIAVSFSHTMDFIRSHGQTERWIVVGTACTVVGLTIQSGMEVYRDRRDARPLGAPVFLLTVGVLVELAANASTAPPGLMNRIVAAWPVPVAAAALHIWTRRLAGYATAASPPAPAGGERSRTTFREVPETVPVDTTPFRNLPEAAPGSLAPAATLDAAPAIVPLVVDPVQATVDELLEGTHMDRGRALLAVHPALSADQIARYLGCSDRYGRMIRQDADGPQTPDHIHPDQDAIDLAGVAA